jgi:hypothetical protein
MIPGSSDMSTHKHHLAAILFTGAAGNPTSDRSQDTWHRQYHEILMTHHATFGGRIVNYYGLCSVSLFGCTLDAMRCARSMQKELLAIGKPDVRMGLHIGEVLDECEDVTGASVNQAARIQALSTPGSVLFSDIVFAQIRNQPEFKVAPLGRFRMKNIPEKVRTYALKEADIVVPSRTDILKYQHLRMFQAGLRSPLNPLVTLKQMTGGWFSLHRWQARIALALGFLLG